MCKDGDGGDGAQESCLGIPEASRLRGSGRYGKEPRRAGVRWQRTSAQAKTAQPRPQRLRWPKAAMVTAAKIRARCAWRAPPRQGWTRADGQAGAGGVRAFGRHVAMTTQV